MDWHWYSGKEKDVFLIPIDEISANISVLGNHPSVEAIQKYLDEEGIAKYNNWRIYHVGQQHDKSWIVWEGHEVGKRWKDSLDSPISYKLFANFQELFDYVNREGINMQPIRVMMEGDGEIFIMEGRHRYMSARILGMKELPCVIQVRNVRYEPKPIRTFQRIR